MLRLRVRSPSAPLSKTSRRAGGPCRLLTCRCPRRRDARPEATAEAVGRESGHVRRSGCRRAGSTTARRARPPSEPTGDRTAPTTLLAPLDGNVQGGVDLAVHPQVGAVVHEAEGG